MFETEQAVFDANLRGWLDLKMQNLSVLIRGPEIIGFFGTPAEAYGAGVQRFGATMRADGSGPFFIKQINLPVDNTDCGCNSRWQ